MLDDLQRQIMTKY